MYKFITVAVILPMIAASQLHAEYRIGDIGAVALSADSSIEYNSNIYLNSDETDDVIARVKPMLNFRANEGFTSIDAQAGFQSKRYKDQDDNNTDDIRSHITVIMPDENHGEIYSLQLDAGYNQRSNPDASLGTVTETNDFALRLKGRYDLSNRTNLRAEVDSLNSASQTDGYADIDTLSFPVALYFKYDESVSIGAGYRLRNNKTSGGYANDVKSTDHALYLGLENLRSELLSYDILVGYQNRNFTNSSNLDDESGAYLQASVTWAATEMADLELTAGNDYSTSASSQSDETLYTQLQVTHRFDERRSARFGVRYEDVTYNQASVEDRQDEQWSLFLHGTYTLIPQRLSLNGRLTCADRDSDQSYSTYQNAAARIGCNFLF